jgi:hypothetical protein
MEGISKSPVGGVIEDAISLARPALVVVSVAAATGAAATSALAVAGSVVAGLGIVDWFRKLGSAKVNENLESLGQATEEALDQVERVLLEHGTTIDEIRSRLNSKEFADGMASASLQALRTAQADRLKRLALILANGVKENDLGPEGLDDMMRAAVELKDEDITLLGKLYLSQNSFLVREGKNPDKWHGDIQQVWHIFVDSGNLPRHEHLSYRSAFSRLESVGLVQQIAGIGHYGVGHDLYALLMEGKKFHERLQEIEVKQ